MNSATLTTSNGTAYFTARERDQYGRSNTLFYVNGKPAANIVKVPRQSRYIVTDWHTGNRSNTRKFAVRRDAVKYAEALVQMAVTADRNADEDGYDFCPDGECGACDNTGLSCRNPQNPETGWAF